MFLFTIYSAISSSSITLTNLRSTVTEILGQIGFERLNLSAYEQARPIRAFLIDYRHLRKNAISSSFEELWRFVNVKIIFQ